MAMDVSRLAHSTASLSSRGGIINSWSVSSAYPAPSPAIAPVRAGPVRGLHADPFNRAREAPAFNYSGHLMRIRSRSKIECRSSLKTQPTESPDLSMTVATDEGLKVRFIVPEFVTEPGQDLRVVGSLPELGSWVADNAPPMTWHEGHQWILEIPLPRLDFDFKIICVEADYVRWEKEGNRSVQMGEDADGIPMDIMVQVSCWFDRTLETGLSLEVAASKVESAAEMSKAVIEMLQVRSTKLLKRVTGAGLDRLKEAVQAQSKEYDNLSKLLNGEEKKKEGSIFLPIAKSKEYDNLSKLLCGEKKKEGSIFLPIVKVELPKVLKDLVAVDVTAAAGGSALLADPAKKPATKVAEGNGKVEVQVEVEPEVQSEVQAEVQAKSPSSPAEVKVEVPSTQAGTGSSSALEDLMRLAEASKPRSESQMASERVLAVARLLRSFYQRYPATGEVATNESLLVLRDLMQEAMEVISVAQPFLADSSGPEIDALSELMRLIKHGEMCLSGPVVAGTGIPPPQPRAALPLDKPAPAMSTMDSVAVNAAGGKVEGGTSLESVSAALEAAEAAAKAANMSEAAATAPSSLGEAPMAAADWATAQESNAALKNRTAVAAASDAVEAAATAVESDAASNDTAVSAAVTAAEAAAAAAATAASAASITSTSPSPAVVDDEAVVAIETAVTGIRRAVARAKKQGKQYVDQIDPNVTPNSTLLGLPSDMAAEESRQASKSILAKAISLKNAVSAAMGNAPGKAQDQDQAQTQSQAPPQGQKPPPAAAGPTVLASGAGQGAGAVASQRKQLLEIKIEIPKSISKLPVSITEGRIPSTADPGALPTITYTFNNVPPRKQKPSSPAAPNTTTPRSIGTSSPPPSPVRDPPPSTTLRSTPPTSAASVSPTTPASDDSTPSTTSSQARTVSPPETKSGTPTAPSSSESASSTPPSDTPATSTLPLDTPSTTASTSPQASPAVTPSSAGNIQSQQKQEEVESGEAAKSQDTSEDKAEADDEEEEEGEEEEEETNPFRRFWSFLKP
eukprot:gene921-5226_t